MQLNDLKHILKRNKGWVAMGSTAAVCLVALTTFALWPSSSATEPASQPMQLASAAPVMQHATPPRLVDSGAPFSFAPLVQRVSPAVVSVTVEERIKDSGGPQGMEAIPEPFRQFFRRFGHKMPQAAPRKAISMGSGFIISKDGYIVTNNHVVKGGTKIKVKMTDGRTFTAKIIGTDEATDVALLKIKADKPLPMVSFGDDRSLHVGDWVIAVGNPFGLSNTVTAGIVSSLGRDITRDQPYTDFIQIDASINKGNSGGPTFNLRGQVMGMNSMIFSPTGGSVGIGFAIPANTVKDVVAQLKAHGKVSRGWLGVLIQPVTPEMANSLGLKKAEGAIVAKVVDDAPAQKAGVKPGDVILKVNGAEVKDGHDLTKRIAAIPAGKTAHLEVLRNEHHKTITVVIAQRKDEKVAENDNTPSAPHDANAKNIKELGMHVAPITDDVRQQNGIDDEVKGVIVTKVDPNSDASDKGIQPGTVIVSVANHPVHSPEEMEKRVRAIKAAGRKNALLMVATQHGRFFIAVGLKK